MDGRKRGIWQWFKIAFRTETDECQIWPFRTNGRGYPEYKRWGKTYRVHRVVCQLHNGKPPFKNAHAAHMCGNKMCVNKRHLVWASASENAQHKFLHGKAYFPERRRLTEGQVRDIRKRKREGCTLMDLVNEYGVSYAAIRKIARRESYRDVV